MPGRSSTWSGSAQEKLAVTESYCYLTSLACHQANSKLSLEAPFLVDKYLTSHKTQNHISAEDGIIIG